VIKNILIGVAILALVAYAHPKVNTEKVSRQLLLLGVFIAALLFANWFSK
jgi:hypothetical protein